MSEIQIQKDRLAKVLDALGTEAKDFESGHSVSIFPLAYFLAAKFDAFNDRGIKDPRNSKDLEDICSLLKYVNDIDSEIFKECSAEASTYLREQLIKLARQDALRECVHGHLGNSTDSDRVLIAIEALK